MLRFSVKTCALISLLAMNSCVAGDNGSSASKSNGGTKSKSSSSSAGPTESGGSSDSSAGGASSETEAGNGGSSVESSTDAAALGGATTDSFVSYGDNVGGASAASEPSAGGTAAATSTSQGGTSSVGGGGSTTGPNPIGGTSSATSSAVPIDTSHGLATLYSNFFPIGAAVSHGAIAIDRTRLLTHFNHLTAENAMKGGNIHPSADKWNYAEADEIAELARAQGWKLTGHTLVWHQQQPTWMFANLTAGDPASIETLKARMKSHIEGMVARYGDVVDNWDVVNEAISDSSSATYRTTGTQWYTIFGGPDFIYWAYRYTKDALEAQAPGSSVGKLYYNDYNETIKADRILTMCDWLENYQGDPAHPEGGIHIDGIGMQAHWTMTWPSISEIDTTIQKFVGGGYKVKLSELDITVYNDYSGPNGSFLAAPSVAFTPELDAAIAARYAGIFEMLRTHVGDVTSVTFWGMRDENSWLRSTPVPNRPNYPLLWNAYGDKAALSAISTFEQPTPQSVP